MNKTHKPASSPVTLMGWIDKKGKSQVKIVHENSADNKELLVNGKPPEYDENGYMIFNHPVNFSIRDKL